MTAIAQLQVNPFCADVDKCLAFYNKVGMAEAFRAPSSGPIEHVEVEAAGLRIGLTSARVANDLVDLGVDPASNPASEIVLWCNDTDVMYDRALAAGATGVVASMDSPDGRLRYGWVRDPDGHQVKIVQKR